MSTLIRPDQIESALQAKWDQLAKENWVRACLFNLIVFNRYSDQIEYTKARTDYTRTIVQKVIEKFPCRLIFISEDPKAKKAELKVAIDVIPHGPGAACDHIDIGVSGSEITNVPFTILPHILPDLPVILLWTEDPAIPHPLLEPLSKLASRLIFDSECADNIQNFAKTVLALKKTHKYDVADLNWARTEGWRDLICSLFNKRPAIDQIEIQYNDFGTDYYCHLQVQSLYLHAWLTARLQEKIVAKFIPKSHPEHGPGTIVGIKIHTKDNTLFDCERIPTRKHMVDIRASSPEQCELPYHYLLGHTATGQSLVHEICSRGTSVHYLEMLKELE